VTEKENKRRKAPKTKLQHPEKLQDPSFKLPRRSKNQALNWRKDPNTKLQVPEKLRTSSSKPRLRKKPKRLVPWDQGRKSRRWFFEIWSLELGVWSLNSGVCSLAFSSSTGTWLPSYPAPKMGFSALELVVANGIRQIILPF
jgi:hypothetical protein